MTRVVKKVEGAGYTRYRVTISDEAHPATGVRQLAFLRQLATDGIDQGFLQCGHGHFSSLEILHDGVKWVAILESTEETRT